MNTQITERIHRITGLVETKNPGSAAEMIQEENSRKTAAPENHNKVFQTGIPAGGKA